jgi:DNA helicase-2/ATP-dependent DNA helicase PcrA
VNPSSALTAAQTEAVEHYEGPLLVLAGPGSGKTRVITRRIARLVDRGVPARHILAITFTNKAANEMAERVQSLLPGSRVWVSTFHKFCARVLRLHPGACGLQDNFTILDTADQRQVLRQVLSDLDIDPAHFTPERLSQTISQSKNKMQSASAFAQAVEDGAGGYFQTVAARVFAAYQKLLLESNAVDFDDLLLHVCSLLHEYPEIRSELDARYRFILVDEYQDTNLVQYQIVRALSVDYRNLCATGDPDQSIYGWRGAEIANILRFEHDFPDAKIVRLEHNFRSTPEILAMADDLIARNAQRKEKTLIPQQPGGRPVELLCFADAAQESDGLARMIREQVATAGRSWNEFAVFYRVNAMSRQIELSFRRHKVPYQVAAGLSFYDRAEVKDLLAYLRLIFNPADQTAFLRVVNRPLRGIGKTSLTRLQRWAADNGSSLLDAAAKADTIADLKPSRKAVANLKRFAELIADLAKQDDGQVGPLLERLLSRTGYAAAWQNSHDEDSQQRLAVVEEVLALAREFDASHPEGDGSLAGFLETTSLTSDVDSLEENAGRVTLMTLHSAKGLEFPVVFIDGVEHGLIPHERSLRDNDPREIEEERRLLFVGITRAKQELYLTRSDIRVIHGRPMFTVPSMFLTEIKPDTRPMHNEFLRASELTGDLNDSENGADEAVEFDPAKFDDDASMSQAQSGGSLRSTPTTPSPRPSGLNLVTAAELLAGLAAGNQPSAAFQVGMRVRHPQYGTGTVIAHDGAGRLARVTVQFSSGEERSYVLAKCPLQPVG